MLTQGRRRGIGTLAGIGLAFLFLAAPAAFAGAATGSEASSPTAGIPYSRKGADTCIRCHDQDSKFPVFSIFKSPHGNVDDPRTPFAKLQCETCHGPGGKHTARIRPGQKRPPIPFFAPKSPATVQQANAVCLSCHKGNKQFTAWHGSVHQREDIACVSCHTIHATHDPILTKAEQPQVCVKCHTDIRNDIHKASTHPLRDGKMACTDCHQPHGSMNPNLLAKPTVNDTCYTCHADKRGPFLWEHEPVAEDCTLCHSPHGSNRKAMLRQQPPLLCQSCHSPAGHPSIARTGVGLPGANPSAFLLQGSCMNCHSQIHGSNNPSGAELNR